MKREQKHKGYYHKECTSYQWGIYHHAHPSGFQSKFNDELDRHYEKPLKAAVKWVFNKPNEIVSSSERQFNLLAAKWKDETGLFSTTYQKVMNDAYLDIIGMGREVVPFILKDLQNNGPAHWHTALKSITKENPVEVEDLGKPKKVREAWISWGIKKNLI